MSYRPVIYHNRTQIYTNQASTAATTQSIDPYIHYRITNAAYDLEAGQKIDVDCHGLGIIRKIGRCTHNNNISVEIVFHLAERGTVAREYWIARHKVRRGERYSGDTLVELEIL